MIYYYQYNFVHNILNINMNLINNLLEVGGQNRKKN